MKALVKIDLAISLNIRENCLSIEIAKINICWRWVDHIGLIILSSFYQ
jgi:hypothetical protein